MDVLDSVLVVLGRGAEAGLVSVRPAVACSDVAGLDDLDSVLAVLAGAAEAGLASVCRAFACAVVAGLDDDGLDSVLAVLA